MGPGPCDLKKLRTECILSGKNINIHSILLPFVFFQPVKVCTYASVTACAKVNLGNCTYNSLVIRKELMFSSLQCIRAVGGMAVSTTFRQKTDAR